MGALCLLKKIERYGKQVLSFFATEKCTTIHSVGGMMSEHTQPMLQVLLTMMERAINDIALTDGRLDKGFEHGRALGQLTTCCEIMMHSSIALDQMEYLMGELNQLHGVADRCESTICMIKLQRVRENLVRRN